MTIIVDSFDGYSDLWPVFFAVFEKQWPDCPFDIKLVSNFHTYKDICVINVGLETSWSDRTLKALKQIETEYIILLLEDYLFGKSINTEEINKALEFAKTQNIKYLRFTNIPKSRFHTKEDIFPLYQDEEYAINLQAAIWKKDYLIEILEKYPGNAWEVEVALLRETVNAEHKVLEGCFGMQFDPLHIRNGVLKGKWFPKEIKYFKSIGIDVQWNERGKLNCLQVMKYNSQIWLKEHLSYDSRKKIKSILKKCGVKFISDL